MGRRASVSWAWCPLGAWREAAPGEGWSRALPWMPWAGLCRAEEGQGTKAWCGQDGLWELGGSSGASGENLTPSDLGGGPGQRTELGRV